MRAVAGLAHDRDDLVECGARLYARFGPPNIQDGEALANPVRARPHNRPLSRHEHFRKSRRARAHRRSAAADADAQMRQQPLIGSRRVPITAAARRLPFRGRCGRLADSPWPHSAAAQTQKRPLVGSRRVPTTLPNGDFCSPAKGGVWPIDSATLILVLRTTCLDRHLSRFRSRRRAAVSCACCGSARGRASEHAAPSRAGGGRAPDGAGTRLERAWLVLSGCSSLGSSRRALERRTTSELGCGTRAAAAGRRRLLPWRR